MTAHGHDNDPDFLADLAEIRDECMSGPYPEHLPKIFPRWKDGFQLSITKIIQHSATNNEAPLDGENEWQTVRAVCHVANEAESYQAALVHLYALARCTFRSQPLRPFLHGILIFGSTIELWTFDRSGMYVSQALDLRVDYFDVVSIVVGLSLMPLKELGTDDIILKDNSTDMRQVTILGEVMELRENAIVAPQDVFGDGLVCYYARKRNEQRWSYVVKFKWRNSFKSEEEEIFKVVQDKGISNVASLVHHHRIRSTAELRAGLRHQAGRNLLESGHGLHHGRGFENYSVQSDVLFRNRTCMCFVFTPIGLPLSTFRGPPELLVVLRDAIQAHRDLLQKANVLHRDVSAGNILIDETTKRGMLIDFDVAMDLSQRTPTGKSIAGTLQYMAAAS